MSNKYSTVEDFCADLSLIWDNCLLFNNESSEICRQANQMKSISQLLIKKMKLFEAQATPEAFKEVESDDSDFGLLIDPALYVRYDDKVKFAEMLKNCTREQLTQVIQLLRAESNSEHHVIDKMSQDRFQVKIDSIQKPLFDKCLKILSTN